MKRRFENASEGIYWEVAIAGSWLNVRGGALGAPGADEDSKNFGTVAAVEAEAARRIDERLAAGFREVMEPAAGTFDARTLWNLIAERSEAPLPPFESTSAGELAVWRALAANADLSVWADRMVLGSPVDPAKIGFGKYAGQMTRDVHGCAVVCAMFSNLEILCAWDDDDEQTFLVSRTPTAGGFHRVYWFVARFVELDGYCFPSISSFLWRDREVRSELPAIEPEYLDPIVLSRRSTWLTSALAGVGHGSMEEDTKNVADVARFEAESALLAEHPHLACYWLLHHHVAGNTRMLATALERSDGSAHPWVRGLRGLVSRSTAAAPLHIGCLDSNYCEEFARGAPRRAFGE